MKNKNIFLFIVFLIPIILSGQNNKVIKDIPYSQETISDRQKLDIYFPKIIEDKMPCLVWIHGGAWLAGSKDYLAPEIDTLLHHGYIVASIGYRLSNEAIFPAQINDCKAAVRFLKANHKEYNIDTSRMAVAGPSAGGHLSALIGTSGNVTELEDLSQGNKKSKRFPG